MNIYVYLTWWKVHFKCWCCRIFIEDILDKNKYLNILKQNFIRSVTTMTIYDTFYKDNDLKYKWHRVQEYLLYDCPKLFSLSLSSSPQLSNLKSVNNCKIRVDKDFKIWFHGEWNDINKRYLKIIISNISTPLYFVIKYQWYTTRY